MSGVSAKRGGTNIQYESDASEQRRQESGRYAADQCSHQHGWKISGEGYRVGSYEIDGQSDQRGNGDE